MWVDWGKTTPPHPPSQETLVATLAAYLEWESEAPGERLNPRTVLGKFLLIFQRCHLQLCMNRGKLSEQRLLSRVGL